MALTLSWRRPLSYRNQSIDLQSKSMDWFLYDNGLRHERVKWIYRKSSKSHLKLLTTSWKVPSFGVFRSKSRGNMEQKHSEYEHFSRSVRQKSHQTCNLILRTHDVHIIFQMLHSWEKKEHIYGLFLGNYFQKFKMRSSGWLPLSIYLIFTCSKPRVDTAEQICSTSFFVFITDFGQTSHVVLVFLL